MDWHVGQTADDLILRAAVQPLIIVGIYNLGKARIYEYTPLKRRASARTRRPLREFLMQEVMPFIQQEYQALSTPASPEWVGHR